MKLNFKYVILLLVTCLLPICCPMKSFSQSAKEKIEKDLMDYISLSRKKQYEKASEKLEDAQHRAMKIRNGDIGFDFKSLLSYLLSLDLKKQGKTGYDYFNALTSVTTFGVKPDADPQQYHTSLATADAYLKSAKRIKVEYKAMKYLYAIMLIDNLKNKGLQPEILPNWKALFEIAGYDVSEQFANSVRKEASDSLAAMPGWMFLRNARNAIENNDTKARIIVATYCINKARELGVADADALEGYVYQYGKLGKKDRAKADSLYKVASSKGSVWGSVHYAQRLFNDGEYMSALKIVQRHESDSEFGKEGGNYFMARLIEKGVVNGATLSDALRYYTANNEKCRWKAWNQDATKRISALQQRVLDEEMEQLCKERGKIEIWSIRELSAAAESYERIKDTATSLKFRKLAAEKGHSRSANIYFVTAYKNRKMIEIDMPEAVSLLKLSEEENYPPTLYNLAFIYSKGLGVDKDVEKALQYNNRYESIRLDYDTDDFSESEFLPRSAR